MAKTDKAAQLRKIAAKVREVAGACNEDGIWRACIAIGPLFKEAYEAGAWQREGSQIGDKLKRVSTDRQQLRTDGQTPVWKIDAWFAVVGPLVDHLTPVDGGEKENLEFEAGIAADAIEEEAKRIEGPTEPGDLSAPKSRRGAKGKEADERFAEIERLYQHVKGEDCLDDTEFRALKKRVRNWLLRDWDKRYKDDGGSWRDPLSEEARVKLCHYRTELLKLWQ